MGKQPPLKLKSAKFNEKHERGKQIPSGGHDQCGPARRRWWPRASPVASRRGLVCQDRRLVFVYVFCRLQLKRGLFSYFFGYLINFS